MRRDNSVFIAVSNESHGYAAVCRDFVLDQGHGLTILQNDLEPFIPHERVIEGDRPSPLTAVSRHEYAAKVDERIIVRGKVLRSLGYGVIVRDSELQGSVHFRILKLEPDPAIAAVRASGHGKKQ